MNERESFGQITPYIEAHMCETMLEPAFSGKHKEIGKVLCAIAAEKDVRVFVQQGCFKIHSDKVLLDDRSECESIRNEARSAKLLG